MPPTTFGTLRVFQFGLPGSTRSGENAEKEVAAGDESLPLENRPHHFVRRPGIRRRFEHHEVTGSEMLGNHLDG
jgi:hypothetical protein